MPPKDKYYNRHAAEARERDEMKQSSERAAKAKAAEDAKWVEDDKKALKKAAQASEIAAKEAEAERRRQEKLQQLQDEEREMSSKVPTKVSKKAMQRDVAKLVSNYNAAFASVRGGAVQEENTPLPSGNVNAKGGKGDDEDDHHVVASGVDASLDALSGGGRRGGGGRLHMPSSIADRHIGRRARVQFKLFQQDNLPKLKEEKPNLRISQYNDLLWERWQKSPLNPFVQRAEARAAEAVEREKNWMFANDSEVSDTEE